MGQKRTLKSSGAGLDWGALVALIVHPTKVLIVEAMAWIDRPLSASELENVLNGKPSMSAISYHIASLVQYGVLTQADKHRVRGTWKTLYVFTPTVRG